MALTQELKGLILSALGWKERADELIAAIEDPESQFSSPPASAENPEFSGEMLYGDYHLEPSIVDAGDIETNALTVDLSAGSIQTITLTDDVEISVENPEMGAAYLLELLTGEGGSVVTWASDILWPDGTAPTVSTDPNEACLVNLLATPRGYLASFAQSYDLPAVAASLTSTHSGFSLVWEAATAGAAGNSITIELADDVDPGDETVEVTGTDIVFHLNDGGTTFDVVEALAEDGDVTDLVSLVYTGGAGVVIPTAFFAGQETLSGGLD